METQRCTNNWEKVHDQLLFGLDLYANAEGWKSGLSVTGYTSIKKMDVTTSKEVQYRSDTNYRGTPWHDWGLFYFEDSTKPPQTVNMSLILGFVRFNTPGFPTPNYFPTEFQRQLSIQGDMSSHGAFLVM